MPKGKTINYEKITWYFTIHWENYTNIYIYFFNLLKSGNQKFKLLKSKKSLGANVCFKYSELSAPGKVIADIPIQNDQSHTLSEAFMEQTLKCL